MVDTGFPWILLATALYGSVHSLLAARRVKAWAAARWGPAAYRRYYRLGFTLVATFSALPLAALVARLPDRLIYRIPAPWALAALAGQAAALLVLLAGVRQTGTLRFLGLQALFAAREEPPESLVTGGLYRWVRHPLYSATFLLLWLAPVMSWNLLALDLGLSVYMLVGSQLEEQKLVQQFGAAYETYRRQTPRILPAFKRRP